MDMTVHAQHQGEDTVNMDLSTTEAAGLLRRAARHVARPGQREGLRGKRWLRTGGSRRRRWRGTARTNRLLRCPVASPALERRRE
jgi:hypothetical protein